MWSEGLSLPILLAPAVGPALRQPVVRARPPAQFPHAGPTGLGPWTLVQLGKTLLPGQLARPLWTLVIDSSFTAHQVFGRRWALARSGWD